MSGFADIHHHLIYGMDDGPSGFEEMTKMLHAAYDDGITNIVATPHATPGVELFPYKTFLQRLREARMYCSQQEMRLQIYPGAEILYTPFAAQMVADGRIPTLAKSRNVLIEFVPDVEFCTIEEAITSFRRNGFIPILAHMERYGCLMKKPGNAEHLKKMCKVAFQVNCSTIIHGRDGRTNKTIKKLLDERLIDYVASDAHNTHTRPCRMQAAYQTLLELVDEDYAEQLVGMV